MDVVNEHDLDWQTVDEGQTNFKRKRLASAAGGEDLGCSRYELPAGGRSWPYHYHTGNEEALFVTDGSGRLRTPDGDIPLEAGDYVALPAGPEGGHRVVNDGDDPLHYLAVSTMTDPDVTVYPDSGKIGVFAASPPGGDGERDVEGYYRVDDDVSYWEGER